MEINTACVNIVKFYEGFRSRPYLDPVGIPTIGYGSTYYENDTKVTLQDQPITSERAIQLLLYNLSKFASGVNTIVKVPLNNNQFNALVSFAYNVGLGALKKSTLLKLVNSGNYKGASEQFIRWNKAGGQVLPGLTKRREAERNLWQTP
jgi:lysozyme